MFSHAKDFTLYSVMLLLFCAATEARAQRRPEPPPRVHLPASTSFGTIKGRVLLPSGVAPKSRFKVGISSGSNTGTMLHTDANGEFVFNNVPEGVYEVEVVGDTSMYDPIVEQATVLRGGRTSMTIYLKEKGRATEKPASDVVSVAELKQQVPDAARREFERATSLIRAGEREKAIEHFKQAISLYPQYLMARNDLGVQYLKLKRLDEAAEQLGAALEINPSVFNPRLNLGIVLVEQKKFSEAVEHLNQAAEINSSEPAPFLYLGIASIYMDDLDAAEEALTKSLRLGDDKYTLAHYYMAQVYMKRGDGEKATSELKTYLEKSPEGEQAASARSLLEKIK